MKIPDDWSLLKLSEIADVKGGKRLPKGYALQDENNGYPYITVSDMYVGGVDFKNIKYIPLEVVDKVKRYRVKKEDIIIAVAGNTLGIVSKIPEELDDANLTENADMVTNIQIDKEYLFQILSSSIIQKKIENEKTTNAQPKLALERIRKFEIPVPNDKKELKKIATILFTWDKVIELREKLIEQKKEQKKGLMQKLFMGHIRVDDQKNFTHEQVRERLHQIEQGKVPVGYRKTKLGIIPNDWKEEDLENHAEIKGRIGWKGLKQEEYTTDGPYLIAGKHIKSPYVLWNSCDHISIDRYEESKEIALQEGDVIFSKDGSLGNPAYIDCLPGEATINSTMMLVRVNSEALFSKFFYHILNGEQFKKLIREKTSGSSIPHLFQRDMKKFRIQLPPLEEQYTISSILSTSDKEIINLQKELEMLKEQKKGLMQVLLTGKVRVKV